MDVNELADLYGEGPGPATIHDLQGLCAWLLEGQDLHVPFPRCFATPESIASRNVLIFDAPSNSQTWFMVARGIRIGVFDDWYETQYIRSSSLTNTPHRLIAAAAISEVHGATAPVYHTRQDAMVAFEMRHRQGATSVVDHDVSDSGGQCMIHMHVCRITSLKSSNH